MILETERLYLRKMSQADFKDLCKIMQDEETMYAYEGAFSDTEVQEWLDRQILRYQKWGFGLWAVILKETNEMVGQCGLTMQPWKDKEVLEIGYLFGRIHWHKGYATEAARACKQYAFETLNAEEVCSIIRDTNIASQNVAIRNGMIVTDSQTKHYRGVDMPHYRYVALNIKIQELKPDMVQGYVDFFDNRAFSDGNINKGCYCVWHHWTEKHEYERSQLPMEKRASCKRDYAIRLIEGNRLHGFVALHNNEIIGFANADLKDNYFRLSKDNNPDSWIDIHNDDRVLAIVCFTVAPSYRGRGIAKKLLSFACEFAEWNGYDYVESYPSDGEFNPNNCCGSKSMYEAQGFSIISINNGVIARKKIKKCQPVSYTKKKYF